MRLALPLAHRTLQSASAMRRRAIVLASSSSTRTYQTAASALHKQPGTTVALCHRRRQDSHPDIIIRGGNVGAMGGHKKNYYTTHSQLPSEHQMVYEMCRKFADEELSPNAGKWDKEHAFPVEAVNKLVRKFCSHVV